MGMCGCFFPRDNSHFTRQVAHFTRSWSSGKMLAFQPIGFVFEPVAMCLFFYKYSEAAEGSHFLLRTYFLETKFLNFSFYSNFWRLCSNIIKQPIFRQKCLNIQFIAVFTSIISQFLVFYGLFAIWYNVDDGFYCKFKGNSLRLANNIAVRHFCDQIRHVYSFLIFMKINRAEKVTQFLFYWKTLQN